jgi:endonuclease/exonuclease/phosphatase family metal-dependent hydrolase
MRRRTSSLLACLLVAACASAPAPDRIRLLTYNIHAGRDASGVNNLQRVADLIESARPDVVLLQEVDRMTTRSGGADHLAELERMTKMHAVFGKAIDFQGGQYGIAILSRWPIDTSETIALRGTPAEARVALVAETGGLRIINTHFDASDNEAFRLEEVGHLVEEISRFRRLPMVVGGDLNSTPDSAVYTRLRENGLRDAFAECGGSGGLTYPADAPVKRIDYLFIPRTYRCIAADVQSSQASDHRALLVEIAK